MAAHYAKEAGKDPSKVKIAMIYQDDAFSLDVRQGALDQMKKYKMTAAIDDRMPKDLNDITGFLTKVKAIKPDVLSPSRTARRPRSRRISRKPRMASSARRSGMKR
jgi:ABC-type branched-subunit amino acid transport system substrate-binding protein